MPFDLAPQLDDALMVLQLRAQWEVQFTGRGECSWSFVMARVDSIDQKAQLAELWLDNIKALWMARRPPEWHFTRILIEDRFPAETVPLEIPINEYGPAGDFNGAPVQITPVLKWTTAYQGRSYRGRSYWGQIRLEDLQGTVYNSALHSALQTFGNAMYDTFADPVLLGPYPKLAVVSRQHNLAPEPIGRYALVTNWQLPYYLGIQRRRQRYYNG